MLPFLKIKDIIFLAHSVLNVIIDWSMTKSKLEVGIESGFKADKLRINTSINATSCGSCLPFFHHLWTGNGCGCGCGVSLLACHVVANIILDTLVVEEGGTKSNWRPDSSWLILDILDILPSCGCLLSLIASSAG